jgi:uncharacterized membrane protein YfcA
LDYLIICLAAFLASGLTFFSGFGLGTILLPVFALFFPVDMAVALTGVVHLLNNLFKMVLIGNQANWKVVLKFGIPAIIAAFFGAWLLMSLSDTSILYEYKLGTRLCTVTPIKLIIAILMIVFAVLELVPAFKNMQFSQDKLYVGGIFSGFFGGLSGHQGALRSAFLIKCGLSKEAFIATGVMIASVVDISRISVYLSKYSKLYLDQSWRLLVAAIIAAFAGAVIGKLLLKKITIEVVHITVVILVIIMGLLLGLGIV